MALSCVRPFEEGDIPLVAEIHRAAFGTAPEMSPQLLYTYERYFRTVFLDHPWRDTALNSLVWEDKGQATGFLGVVPRMMQFKGKSVLAAVSSQFAVAPASRGLTGVLLMKAFLGGAQDLSLADRANDISRRLWEGLGGKTVHCHSNRWLYLLRPTRLAIETRVASAVVRGLLRFPAAISDSVVSRLPQGLFGRPRPTALIGRQMNWDELLHILSKSNADLRPDYSGESFRWLVQRLEGLEEFHGKLTGVLVESPEGAPIGSYVYYRKPTLLSKVLMIAATPNGGDGVLAHLLNDSWKHGCSAVGGRVPPRLQHAFARVPCQMDPRPKWFLAHSRSEPLMQAITNGEDMLSELDGELISDFNFLASRS